MKISILRPEWSRNVMYAVKSFTQDFLVEMLVDVAVSVKDFVAMFIIKIAYVLIVERNLEKSE